MSLSLDVCSMVLGLARHRVDWVLAGSVAALAWYPGPWPFIPGDLDVVPARTPANFRRLAETLEALGAKPVHDPAWDQTLSPSTTNGTHSWKRSGPDALAARARAGSRPTERRPESRI